MNNFHSLLIAPNEWPWFWPPKFKVSGKIEIRAEQVQRINEFGDGRVYTTLGRVTTGDPRGEGHQMKFQRANLTSDELHQWSFPLRITWWSKRLLKRSRSLLKLTLIVWVLCATQLHTYFVCSCCCCLKAWGFTLKLPNGNGNMVLIIIITTIILLYNGINNQVHLQEVHHPGFNVIYCNFEPL